jgi:hypothetical protein
MAAVALLFASAARQSSLPPHYIMKRVGNLNRSPTSRYTKRYLIRVRWLNSNKGTNCEIEIKKSTRRPFQRASDSYRSNSPLGRHPIESDPVQRLGPIRF